MTDEIFLEIYKKTVEEKSVKLKDFPQEVQDEYHKKAKEYFSRSFNKNLETVIEKEKEFKMIYKTVKGLKRGIRKGQNSIYDIQVDKTGISIGEKVQRFLKDNTVDFQDIDLEYDEEESTDENPDWSGDSLEFSDVDDLAFDKVDLVDKQRELKDKILSAQMTQVEPGDIPTNKLQDKPETKKDPVPDNGTEKETE